MAPRGLIKVLIIGNVATGKTSLIRRYVCGTFKKNHQTTVGVDFTLKSVQVDNQQVKIQLWDIAGQDQFSGLTRVYYRDSIAAIVVYDMFDRKTFESAQKWKSDLDDKVFLPNGDPIPVILLANKVDLLDSVEDDDGKDYVSLEDAKPFVEENGFIGHFQTSAKTGKNVAKAFQELAKIILQTKKKLSKHISSKEQEEQDESDGDEDEDIVDVKQTGNKYNAGGSSPSAANNGKGGCCN